MSEIPEELIEDSLKLLSIVSDTGKIKKGTNEVTKALERGTAMIIYIADDVNPKEITRHLPILAAEKNVAYMIVPTSERLGKSAGIEVGAASVAIVDAASSDGELKSIVERVKQFN
jgi:large subunit ribosomal protein L7Ae